MTQQPDEFTNPYAPVSAEPPLLAAHSQAAAIRREYLSHEASVKAIGVLYVLAAIFLIPLGLWLIAMGLYGLGNPGANVDSPAVLVLVGVVELALGVGQGMTGLGLRQLKNWARTVGIVFSAIGLLGFPIGTLISAYFLYLLMSKKGIYVFSPEYQQVMAATPEIKYKTSILVWILLALLLGFLALGMIAALFTA